MVRTFSVITRATSMAYHLIFPVLLFFALSCAGPSRLQGVTTQEGIEISEGDSKVLFYQIKPKSLNGKFERASYIHPLYSLSGNVITEDFPGDHPHHHGIYSAWHQILLNGRPIADGWTGENLSLQVTNTKVTKESKSLTITSEVLWQHVAGGDRQPIVKENLQIVVHSSSDDYRVIDYDIELVPLMDRLQIGGSDDEKGYGGFSLRLKLPDDIRFVAKDKEVEPQVISVAAGPWLDLKGSFDKGQTQSGVAVFCHPSNPGAPQPWILRKEKSMQNVAYPGRIPVDLTKDGLKLRYRMVIHRSELPEKLLEELYQRYAGK
jgi:hypothetical protein